MVLNSNNPRMGIYGIPGTFPTGIVLEAVQKFDPTGISTVWTRDKVNDVYFWYKQGIKEGHKPWTNEDKGIANFISEHTKFSTSDTNIFGYTLKRLAIEGKIKNEFYTIDIPASAQFDVPFLPSQTQLTEYAKTIKWVAIFGIVGVLVYFTWPVLSKGRKQLTKRMA